MAQNERIDSVSSSRRLDMVIAVVSRGDGEEVVEVLRENGIFQNLICQGRGTAPSSILEMLGLGATEKDVVISVSAHEDSRKTLKIISRKIEFEKPGRGIAFTVPLESIGGIMAFKFLTAELPED